MKRLYLIGYGLIAVLLMAVSCAKEVEVLTGSIYGEVTDSQTGEPVQGVQISLTPGGVTTTTGSDGAYEFQNLDAAQYQLQAKKTDYIAETKRVTVVIGKSVSCDMVLIPMQKLDLSATSLNFGKENTSLSFDIKNKGTSKFNWNISGLSNVDWIEVNPVSGALDGGKSCTVQVSVLREKLTENQDLTLIVNADKESVSLKVNVEVEKKVAKIEVEPSTIDFGKDESVMTFNVKNVGNAGKVEWNITGLDVDWIKIEPMKGALDEGKTQAVKVSLARDLVKEKVKTTVLVNAAGESFPIEILAEENKARYIVADPTSIIIGEKEKEDLTLFSYNGSTNYSVQIKEEGIGWLELSKTAGTIPQYDAANPAMKETIELVVNRKDMLAGEYKCTLVIHSDLEDLEIPVSMKVKEAEKTLEVSPANIELGQDKNGATFTVKNVGNTGEHEWKLELADVECLTATPMSGKLGMGKSATITLGLNRDKLTSSLATSIVVAMAEETVQVSVTAEPKPAREFKVQPTSLSLGKEKTASFTMYSTHGDTAYELLMKESDATWLTFSKKNGVAKDGIAETIEVEVLRESLPAGNYSGTIIVRTDLGDTEIPVTMVVEEQASSSVGTIVSCHNDLEFTLNSCKITGTTAVIDMMVKNIGTTTHSLTLHGGNYSYAYDDRGNKYLNSDLLVALAGNSYTTFNSYTDIPAGVVTKLSIKITNVDESVAVFDNVSIKTNKDSDLILKNIAIGERKSVALPSSQTTGTVVGFSDELEIVLIDCKAGTNYTTLSLQIKNIGKSLADLTLYGGNYSYAYDDKGNKYHNSNLNVALSGSSYTIFNSYTKLPSGIMTNVYIRIANVDVEAKEFTNITIATNYDNDLVLKNVKIRK